MKVLTLITLLWYTEGWIWVGFQNNKRQIKKPCSSVSGGANEVGFPVALYLIVRFSGASRAHISQRFSQQWTQSSPSSSTWILWSNNIVEHIRMFLPSLLSYFLGICRRGEVIGTDRGPWVIWSVKFHFHMERDKKIKSVLCSGKCHSFCYHHWETHIPGHPARRWVLQRYSSSKIITSSQLKIRQLFLVIFAQRHQRDLYYMVPEYLSDFLPKMSVSPSTAPATWPFPPNSQLLQMWWIFLARELTHLLKAKACYEASAGFYKGLQYVMYCQASQRWQVPPVNTLLTLFMEIASWKILPLAHLSNALVTFNITKCACALWAVPSSISIVIWDQHGLQTDSFGSCYKKK